MNVKETQNPMTQMTLSLNTVVEAVYWTQTETRAAGGNGLCGKNSYLTLIITILHIILPVENQHKRHRT